MASTLILFGQWLQALWVTIGYTRATGWIVLLLFTLVSSCGRKTIAGQYVHVNPDKEWELVLTLEQNGMFRLEDRFGCVQLSQSGEWSEATMQDSTGVMESYTLVSEQKVERRKGKSGGDVFYFENSSGRFALSEKQYFPIVESDSIFVLSTDGVFLRNLFFKRTKMNPQKMRVLVQENDIIGRIGKDLYIATVGEGVSMKRARKNLVKCK